MDADSTDDEDGHSKIYERNIKGFPIAFQASFGFSLLLSAFSKSVLPNLLENVIDMCVLCIDDTWVFLSY